jgi:hypothetical protein
MLRVAAMGIGLATRSPAAMSAFLSDGRNFVVALLPLRGANGSGPKWLARKLAQANQSGECVVRSGLLRKLLTMTTTDEHRSPHCSVQLNSCETNVANAQRARKISPRYN